MDEIDPDSDQLPPQYDDRPMFKRTISEESAVSTYVSREPISATAASRVVAVLGGWLFGYNCAIIGGLHQTIVNKFYPLPTDASEADKDEQAIFEGILVSSILVGGLLGSMLGSVAAKKLGRVRALMIATSLGAGGAALLAYLSGAYWILIATRTILGIGIGWCMTVCPLYVHEVAPVEIRSRTGTLVGVSLVGSISLAQFVNYLFHPNDSDQLSDNAWRVQFALGAAPLALLFLFTFFIPESATWYAMHYVSAPVAAAKAAAAHEERQQQRLEQPLLDEDGAELEAPPSPIIAEKNPHRIQGWRVLFRGRQGWRNLLTCFALSASNQLTGINPVIFYLPKIFSEAGIGSVSLIIATAVGGWNLVSALVPLFSLQRIGRRRFFVSTLIVMAVGHILVAISNILQFDWMVQNRPWISLPALLLFIGAYQAGPSALYWVMAPSSFPPRLRDTALSLANALNWLFNAGTVFVFPMMDRKIGVGYTFLVFFGLTLLATIGVYFLVPEKEVVEEVMVVMGDQVVSNLPPGWDGERLRRQSSANHTADPSVYDGSASASGRASRPNGSSGSSRYGSRRGPDGRLYSEDELVSLPSTGGHSGISTGHHSGMASNVMSRAQSVPNDQSPIAAH